MNIYQPADLPLPPIRRRDGSLSTPIPETVWRDEEVRRAMEYALGLHEEQIRENSKIIAQWLVRPLLSVCVIAPFQLPRAGTLGSNNAQLRYFAYEVYEVLAELGEWSDWRIASYFAEGDDVCEQMELGLFVGNNFNQTVVE